MCYGPHANLIRHWVWGEYTFLGDNIFVFVVCLRQIFLDTTKLGRGTKNFGGPPVNASPCG